MDASIPGHDITAKERTVDVLTNENVNFKDLFLSSVVLSGLQKARFERPSPIQLKAIPYGRCGLDLIVQAKSGTGKTCVFTVIALEAIAVNSSCLQVIILAPTREIAIQIEDVIKAIGQDIKGLKVAAFIGGRPVSEDKISAKNCHIAVGSPGRIFQLIELEILKCQNVGIFVLDEADKLLDNNFQSQINSIYSMLPENKQMIAASATYPDELADFVKRYMRDPTFVRLNPKDMALLGVKQYYYLIGEPPDRFYSVFERKIKAVVELLKLYTFQQALIFSNYHSHAKDLSDACNSVGLPATYISGNLEQERRLEAMKMLKDFKCRVLISTDLTSRGIDASNVDVVVNLDVPTDWETYMHRTGRAGRFGSHGAVISIITSGNEKEELFAIARTCNVTINPLTCEAGEIVFGHEPIRESKSEQIHHKKGKRSHQVVNSTKSMMNSDKIPNGNISRPHHNAPATSSHNKAESMPGSNSILNGNISKNHEVTVMSPSREIGKSNSKTSRICEDDIEILRVPSLPELMSKNSKPDSSQFSFAYHDLMDNLKYFQEHGVLQGLKRVEIRKTKKDEKVKKLSHDLEASLRLWYQKSKIDNSAEVERKEVENCIKNGKSGMMQTSLQKQSTCGSVERGWWISSKADAKSCHDDVVKSSREGVTAKLSGNKTTSCEPHLSQMMKSHKIIKEKEDKHVKNKKEGKKRSSSKKTEKCNSTGKETSENQDALPCSHSEEDKAVKNREERSSSKKTEKHNSSSKETSEMPRRSHSELLLPRYSSKFPSSAPDFSIYNPYLMYARSQYENAWYNYYYWWRYWQCHGAHS